MLVFKFPIYIRSKLCTNKKYELQNVRRTKMCTTMNIVNAIVTGKTKISTPQRQWWNGAVSQSDYLGSVSWNFIVEKVKLNIKILLKMISIRRQRDNISTTRLWGPLDFCRSEEKKGMIKMTAWQKQNSLLKTLKKFEYLSLEHNMNIVLPQFVNCD